MRGSEIGGPREQGIVEIGAGRELRRGKVGGGQELRAVKVGAPGKHGLLERRPGRERDVFKVDCAEELGVAEIGAFLKGAIAEGDVALEFGRGGEDVIVVVGGDFCGEGAVYECDAGFDGVRVVCLVGGLEGGEVNFACDFDVLVVDVFFVV